MSEHKIPIPSMLYNTAVGGHVTNSQQIIDENLNREQNDINQETVGAVPYNSTTPNGMGRIVLKKNDNFKQVVEAQTNGNTIFVIKYDFTLTGNVTVPVNCVLEFDGGSINGNYIITGNDTIIKANPVKIFNTDITLSGTWNTVGNIRWFGAHPNNNDNTANIQKVFDSFVKVIIDNKTYKTDALILSKCRIFKGTVSPRGEFGSLSFIFNGESKTALTVFYEPSYPYIQIEGISFKIYGASAAVDDTVCIDLYTYNSGDPKQYSTPIRLEGCRLENFNIGVKSNYMSYYNYIGNCTFTNINYCLHSFSSNNLVIYKCLGFYFKYFIYNVAGNGPISITESSFELFKNAVIYTSHDASILNFHNNYVEFKEGSDVLSGIIRVINSTGNDFQAEGAVKRIYYIYECASFYSVGNNLFVGDLDENQSNKYDFKYIEFYNANGSKLENYIVHDIANTYGNFDISKYYSGVYPTRKNYKSHIEGEDPITKRLATSGSTNLDPVNGNGYWYNETTPRRNARFKTINGIVYFAGIVKKTSTVISLGQKNIINLPITYIGNPDLDWTNFPYWDIFIHDVDGGPVTLRYYPKDILNGSTVEHVAGSMDIIAGDVTKDLNFDGATIMFQ